LGLKEMEEKILRKQLKKQDEIFKKQNKLFKKQGNNLSKKEKLFIITKEILKKRYSDILDFDDKEGN
jgi:hypothetical protein